MLASWRRTPAGIVVPDGLFALVYGDETAAYFLLEVDRGTIPINRTDSEGTSDWRKNIRYKLATYYDGWRGGFHRVIKLLCSALWRRPMAKDDELDLVQEPEEEEEYIQYDIATYPSDYTLSGMQELFGADAARLFRRAVKIDKQSADAHHHLAIALPSRPGEFHPEPLTDPDLILSHHPARATARRLPPSAEPSGSSWHRQLAQAQRR